ncbi:MAG: LysR family transcriptional regulator [Proteobacteria bacterium]|nr:LysR family transcriptional regulator [Pseudomonadota bacterium]
MTRKPTMELRELRYFVDVAEFKSFSKAAAYLRIAQPALSRQVRKLEETLGVELFLRHARGVELTEAGRVLLNRAYAIFQQLDQAHADVTAQAEFPTGTLTIGAPPATGEILIPALVEKARARFPKISLNIVEGFSGFIYDRLMTHQVNIGILYNPAPHRELDILPLVVEPMYVIASADAARREPRAFTVADLARLPLILPRREHSLRQLVENAMADHALEPSIAFQVDGLNILRTMVGRGLGYTLLTYGAVHQDIAAGRLAAIPIAGPGISWTLAVAYRADQGRSRPVEEIVRLIREESRRLVKGGIWRGRASEAGEPGPAARSARARRALGTGEA